MNQTANGSWFGRGLRTTVAPQLESLLHLDSRSARKAVYNESGEDVRLQTPGLDWGFIGAQRIAIARDIAERIQEAFDEIYEKITGGRRTSLDNHLLPTIKTPAVPKTQPRLQLTAVSHTRNLKSIENEQQTSEMDTSIPPSDKTPATCTERMTRSCVKPRDAPHESSISESKISLVDVVATSFRRTTRSRTRKTVRTEAQDKQVSKPASNTTHSESNLQDEPQAPPAQPDKQDSTNCDSNQLEKPATSTVAALSTDRLLPHREDIAIPGSSREPEQASVQPGVEESQMETQDSEIHPTQAFEPPMEKHSTQSSEESSCPETEEEEPTMGTSVKQCPELFPTSVPYPTDTTRMGLDNQASIVKTPPVPKTRPKLRLTTKSRLKPTENGQQTSELDLSIPPSDKTPATCTRRVTRSRVKPRDASHESSNSESKISLVDVVATSFRRTTRSRMRKVVRTEAQDKQVSKPLSVTTYSESNLLDESEAPPAQPDKQDSTNCDSSQDTELEKPATSEVTALSTDCLLPHREDVAVHPRGEESQTETQSSEIHLIQALHESELEKHSTQSSEESSCPETEEEEPTVGTPMKQSPKLSPTSVPCHTDIPRTGLDNQASIVKTPPVPKTRPKLRLTTKSRPKPTENGQQTSEVDLSIPPSDKTPATCTRRVTRSCVKSHDVPHESSNSESKISLVDVVATSFRRTTRSRTRKAVRTEAQDKQVSKPVSNATHSESSLQEAPPAQPDKQDSTNCDSNQDMELEKPATSEGDVSIPGSSQEPERASVQPGVEETQMETQNYEIHPSEPEEKKASVYSKGEESQMETQMQVSDPDVEKSSTQKYGVHPTELTPSLHESELEKHSTQSSEESSCPETEEEEPTVGTSVKQCPRLFPTSVPYLTGTPRTLRKLQEEHSGVKILSVAELLATRSPGRNFPVLPRPVSTLIGKGKRLRSVSLEKLPHSLVTKKPSRGRDVKERQGESDSAGSDHSQSPEGEHKQVTDSDDSPTDSKDSPTEGSSPEFSSPLLKHSSASTEKNVLPPTSAGPFGRSPKSNFVFSLFGRSKGESGVSKLALPSGSNLLVSFLPRNSPKSTQTFELRQAKLAEKIQRKREEEERRRRELETHRQQELQEKIRKREERQKRVVEKQAAMTRKEEEKRKMAQGEKTKEDLLKKEKINLKKAKELEEKREKKKEHILAVEARRRQEEEEKKKKLQQMEEERRMAEELARKRLEQEEEEKLQKKLEKQKLEREKQLQKEAEREKEMRKLEEEKQRLEKQKQKEEEQKRQQEQAANWEETKKRFGQLLSLNGTVTKPASALAKNTTQFIQQLKASGMKPTNTVTKSKPTVLPSTGHMNIPDGTSATMPLVSSTNGSPSLHIDHPSHEESTLNTTFTKEDSQEYSTDSQYSTPLTTTAPEAIKTPISVSYTSKVLNPTYLSYEMTPDPLVCYDNYDIGDLNSEDSTDDEERPKKPIPTWACPPVLNSWMKQQESNIDSKVIDITEIFPPEQLLKDPDLSRIFKRKRKRFYVRSSSAYWDSPLLKKSKNE